MATVAPEVPVLARDEAFEQMYRRYVKDVYHYALALLRNPADAEDVTQTTFLNAYRAFLRGDEIVKPQNWLIKIAHNVARSRYARSTRRVKEVPLDEHLDQLAIPDEERPNVEGVLRALGRLPFNQRAALVMRELEGRSYAEIGDTLGVSVAAVETLIFRARRSLRVRSSALRSITAVPVPASLAGLFEGGGVVAGGFGMGVLVKAALTIVAGTLATGLGGDRANRAVAAPEARNTAVNSAQDVAVVQTRRTAAYRAQTVRAAAHRRVIRTQKQTAGASGSTPVVRNSVEQPAPSAAEATASTTQSAPSSSSSVAPAAPAPVTTTVSETADNVVSTVENTVTNATPTLPVTVPSVPQLPVEPPPLPKLP